MTLSNLLTTIKLTIILVVFSIFFSCNLNSGNNQQGNAVDQAEMVPDSVLAFLLNSAAHDFKLQPNKPNNFREVKVGYLLDDRDMKMYLLCGNFQSTNQEWIPFTTIKTSGYEQYVGEQAEIYCQKMHVGQSTITDLSVALKSKLME